MNPSAFLLVLVLALGGAKETRQEKKEDKQEPAKLRFTLKTGSREGARTLQFAPDGSRLACAGWEGTLLVWDTARGTQLLKIDKPGHEWTRVAFSPDGKHLSAGDLKGTVLLFDALTGKEQGELTGHRGIIELVTYLKDGKTLVTGDSKGLVLFWDVEKKSKLPNRDLSVGENSCLAVTPDGKTLVSMSYTKDAVTLKVWDAVARKQIAALDGLERGILSLALTADGKTLVAGGRGSPVEGIATLWDLTAKKERATLSGHTRDVFAVAVTADGKTALTGSLDDRVKLWDIASGGERLTLEGGRGAGMVVSVAVSADGKWVAAGRSEGVSLWQLSRSASSFPVQIARRDQKKEGPPVTDKERQAIEAEAEALATQGPKGIAALAKKVRDGSQPWKIAALRSLQNLGPDAEPALAAIIQELQSKESDLKRLTIRTLRAIGPKAKAAIPALLEAAKETKDFNGAFAMGGGSNIAEAALEALQAIDPSAMPRLAEAMIPGLLEVVDKGREAPIRNALALLRQLGPHVKPALPKLKAMVADLSPDLLRDVLPIFLVAGEDGMAIVADVLLDAKTTNETKLALMQGYHWERQSTPSTIRLLRGLLKEKSAKVRATALRTLQTVRAKELIPDLIDVLADVAVLDVPSDTLGGDPYYAARALGNQGKDAVPALAKALDQEAPLVRFQAARALAIIGTDAADTVGVLEKRLDDALPVIQIEAAKAILLVGKKNDAALAKIGKHLQADSKLLGPALYALKDVGPAGQPLFPAVKKLALEATNVQVQRVCFDTIRRLKPDAKEVVQIWTKLIKDNSWFLTFPPEEEIRANIKEVQATLPILLKHLQADDVNVRRRTTEILAMLGPAAKDALPALLKALDDEGFVANGAVAALGSMGGEARPAVKVLIHKYESIKVRGGKNEKEDDGAFYKREILTALERIGPAAVEAVPKLIQWLPNEPQAARVLGKIGPDAKAAIPALQATHREGANYAKTWSAFALVKITGKTEPYVAELAGVLQKSKEPFTRRQVIEALVELGPDARAALPVLLRVLQEKSARGSWNTDLRLEAAKSLRHFGADAKPAIPALIDMVQTSYHAAKMAAAETLGAIGPAAKAAIPALEKMATEDDRYRPIVQKALSAIRKKP